MRPVNQLPRDEALALGVEPQSRQPAKAAKARGQYQSAAIFQGAKPNARAVSRIERGNRPGVDLDRDRRCDREFVRGRLLRRRLRGELRPRDLWYRGRQKPRRRGLQKAAAGEMRWFIPHGEEARLRRLEP